MENYDYVWLGYGLKLIAPDGSDVFLQGDEAGETYDELEEAADDEQVNNIISEYFGC